MLSKSVSDQVLSVLLDVIAGVGVPQVTAIYDAAAVAREYGKQSLLMVESSILEIL